MRCHAWTRERSERATRGERSERGKKRPTSVHEIGTGDDVAILVEDGVERVEWLGPEVGPGTVLSPLGSAEFPETRELGSITA